MISLPSSTKLWRAAWALAFVSSEANSQTLTITHTYPQAACQAVLSESGQGSATHSGVDLIFAGMGGAVVPLDATTAPAPQPWSGNAKPYFTIDGFIHDLAMIRNVNSPTADRLYVASGVGGLAALNVSQIPYDLAFKKVTDVGTAFSCSAVDVPLTSTRRIVIVGSNETESSGVVSIVEDVLNSNTQHFRGSFATGPVYSVLATRSLVSNTVTVFAGTACAGLLRFDIPDSNFAGPLTQAVSFPTPTVWSGPGTPPLPTFVRDLYLDPTDKILLAACHTRGVFRFDVSQAGQIAPAGGAWPLDDNPSSVHERYDGLAVSPDKKHLFVARGGVFGEERNQYGPCQELVPCDGASNDEVPGAGEHGVRAYSLSGTPFALHYALDKSIDVTTDSSAMYSMAISTGRGSGSSGSTYVDAACDAQGMQSFRFVPNPPPQFGAYVANGAWDKYDNVVFTSVDDVLLHRHGSTKILYTAFEQGVGTYDVSNDAITGPSDSNLEAPAVQLTGLEDATPPLLFAGSGDGIAFYSLSNVLHPAKIQSSLRNQGHPDYFLQALEGPSSVAPPEHWLYVANGFDFDSTIHGSSVRLWNVSTAFSATPPDASRSRLRGVYLDEQGVTGPATRRKYGGLVALDGGDGVTQNIYVAFGPATGSAPVLDEVHAGVVVIRATYSPISDAVQLQRIALVFPPSLSFANNKDDQVGKVSYDPSSQDLYVALGCSGVMRFSLIGGGGVPSFVSWRACPAGGSAFQAVRVGSNVYTMYLTGVGVEPAVTFGSGSITPAYLKTRNETTTLTYDATSDAFFLADTRAGVHRASIQ